MAHIFKHPSENQNSFAKGAFDGCIKQIHISSSEDMPANFSEDYGDVLSIHTYPGLLIIKKGL